MQSQLCQYALWLDTFVHAYTQAQTCASCGVCSYVLECNQHIKYLYKISEAQFKFNIAIFKYEFSIFAQLSNKLVEPYSAAGYDHEEQYFIPCLKWFYMQ